MTWTSKAHEQLNTPIVVMELELDTGTLYFSNRNIEIAGQGFYEGRVITFGRIHRAVSNTDGHFEISDITSLLSNADQSFTGKDLQSIINRTCIYRVGFEGENISTFKTVFTGKVANFKFRNYEFEILVTDATKLWLENDYGHVISSTDWPNTHTGVGNTKMPIIYGQMTGNI